MSGREFAAAIGITLLLGACTKQAPPEPTRIAPAPVAQMTATSRPAPQPETPAATTPAAEQPQLANEALVALLFEPALATDSPEQAAARFVELGKMSEASVAPGYLTLEAKRPANRTSIDYVKSETGWAFSSAQVALYPTATLDLKALYENTDSNLRARLGKPLWARRVEGSSLKSKGYRVGKSLELTIAEDSDKTHGAIVSLGLGEPQGEAE